MKDILILDDEKIIVDGLKKILLAENFSVSVALDAETALNILDTEKFKLIITDIMLPNTSGFEFIKFIRNKNIKIPVIVISGFATFENAIQSFKSGAFDFIPKPFDIDELMGVVLRGIAFYNHYHGRNPYLSENTPPPTLPDAYYMGFHSWAKVEPDGSVLIGISEIFQKLVGDMQEMEVVSSNKALLQGNVFLNIYTNGFYTHKVWAPLSGNIIELNKGLLSRREITAQNFVFNEWVVRIAPTDLERELLNLSDNIKNIN